MKSPPRDFLFHAISRTAPPRCVSNQFAGRGEPEMKQERCGGSFGTDERGLQG